MPCQDEELRRQLLRMASLDNQVRESLLQRGELYDGYHPEMEAIHANNAARLRTIIAEHGWPVATLVGEDGAQAAWLIVQHSIGEPTFQRQCWRLLEHEASAGTVPPWQPAMLEDRIRMFEGRPQVYGTQLEMDDSGQVRPYIIEDPEHVEERRKAVGLEPLSQRLAREKPWPRPRDAALFEQKYQAWLRQVGWRQ